MADAGTQSECVDGGRVCARTDAANPQLTGEGPSQRGFGAPGPEPGVELRVSHQVTVRSGHSEPFSPVE